MEKQVIHVELGPNTDLHELVEEVHSHGVPRLLERNGETLAVLAPSENYTPSTKEPKSKRNKEALLRMAGVWKDLDADELIDASVHDLIIVSRDRHFARIPNVSLYRDT